MVRARSEFLDGGWYDCLRDALCTVAVRCCGESVDMLDAGCGEGFYTSAVRKALEAEGKQCSAAGVDISRTALIAAARRDSVLQLAVAGVNRLPLRDASCDLLMNVFAPEDNAEFRRVLCSDGVLLKAVPGERHLFGLKQAVYERPYLNPEPSYAPEGFTLLERADIGGYITVSPGQQIRNLFMMTPYYYKTGAADQAKLADLESLETELAFTVFAFRKN